MHSVDRGINFSNSKAGQQFWRSYCDANGPQHRRWRDRKPHAGTPGPRPLLRLCEPFCARRHSTLGLPNPVGVDEAGRRGKDAMERRFFERRNRHLFRRHSRHCARRRTVWIAKWPASRRQRRMRGYFPRCAPICVHAMSSRTIATPAAVSLLDSQLQKDKASPYRR